MKVKLLPLAVTAAIAMPGLALADGPTVYGKMNLSLENVDIDDGSESADNWQVISNSSRFGVKGDGKINSMLKATYLIEWGVDGADNTTLSNRNRSVGLAGNFGALDIGHFDTPVKVAQGKVDQFNDLSGDLQYVLVGDNRATNIIQYTTPKMSGLEGRLAIMPGEQYDTGQDDPKDGLADAFSVSVAFSNDQIYAALAHDSEVSNTIYTGTGFSSSWDKYSVTTTPAVIVDVDGEDITLVPAVKSSAFAMDTTRLVGQFTSGPVQVGAMYQTSELSDDGDLDQDGFLVGGAFTLGQTVLKAQYVSSTTDFGTREVDGESIGLGVDQKMSAQTTLFGYYNMLAYEADTANAQEETKDNLGVGIVHTF